MAKSFVIVNGYRQMKLIIEESDFANKEELQQIKKEKHTPSIGSDIGMGGPRKTQKSDELTEEVMKMLPETLNKKIKEVWGHLDGFNLDGFEIKLTVEGSPFGVGVNGDLTLKYSQKKSEQ